MSRAWRMLDMIVTAKRQMAGLKSDGDERVLAMLLRWVATNRGEELSSDTQSSPKPEALVVSPWPIYCRCCLSVATQESLFTDRGSWLIEENHVHHQVLYLYPVQYSLLGLRTLELLVAGSLQEQAGELIGASSIRYQFVARLDPALPRRACPENFGLFFRDPPPHMPKFYAACQRRTGGT